MEHSVAIRFVIAALLITAGCLLLLFGFSNGGVLFGLATLFFMPRSELTSPIPRRELWLTSGVLFALIMLIITGKHLAPSSVSRIIESVVHHPAVIAPLWLLMLWGLFRH